MTLLAATVSLQCRHARPTFSEVSEALDVLGVDIKVEQKDLKKKYRELVKKHHPDAGGDEKTMSKITVAYERLSSLTKRELEEFATQRNAYRGGSGFGAAGNTYAGSYARSSHAQRTYAGRGQTMSDAYGERTHAWDQQGPEFTRAYGAANNRAHYNYQRGGAFGGGNPFTNSGNPFDMGKYARNMSRLPFGSFVIRGVAAYFIISFVFLLSYRRYSDWRHEDGWKASESLARHEQMEELHRIRREMNEKIAAAKDQQNSKRAQDHERSKELRVMEYSQRRIMELQEMELRCWPKFDESKGSLVKRSFDPAGITYFEPGTANEKRRQLQKVFGESRSERILREEAIAQAEAKRKYLDEHPEAKDAEIVPNEIVKARTDDITNASNAIASMLKGAPMIGLPQKAEP